MSRLTSPPDDDDVAMLKNYRLVIEEAVLRSIGKRPRESLLKLIDAEQ